MMYDTIQEYDIKGDSFLEIGRMTQKRTSHAISVVKYSDFSKWCKDWRSAKPLQKQSRNPLLG